MVKGMFNLLKGIDRGIDKSAHVLLIISIFVMLFFSVLTIFLRWFGQSLEFVEPFVRHLVFLSTFLGGVLATGRGTHIGIDILGKLLESMHKEYLCQQLKRLISLASFGTLCWLVLASVHFVKMEMEFGRESFFGLSTGMLVMIIPFGFSLIAYRFFYIFIASFGPDASNIVAPGGTIAAAKIDLCEQNGEQQL